MTAQLQEKEKKKRKKKSLCGCCVSLSVKIPVFATFQWPLSVIFARYRGYYVDFVFSLTTVLLILSIVLVKYG